MSVFTSLPINLLIIIAHMYKVVTLFQLIVIGLNSDVGADRDTTTSGLTDTDLWLLDQLLNGIIYNLLLLLCM